MAVFDVTYLTEFSFFKKTKKNNSENPNLIRIYYKNVNIGIQFKDKYKNPDEKLKSTAIDQIKQIISQENVLISKINKQLKQEIDEDVDCEYFDWFEVYEPSDDIKKTYGDKFAIAAYTVVNRMYINNIIDGKLTKYSKIEYND